MRPQFMTQDSINSLLTSFDEAKLHYANNNKSWFDRRLQKERGLRDSRFEFPDFELATGEISDEGYTETDQINVRKLYGIMKDLPIAVAADQRFWSGLAHTYCWDYIQYRRKKELTSGNDNSIKNSYFYNYDAKRSSHVNCLSRLWWAGRVSYDESSTEDPFALTSLLTCHAFASRILLFSSSGITANRNISLGILDAIKEQQDLGVELKRKHFAGAAKYLNRMGAITLLDCMSRKRVKELVIEYYGTEEFELTRM